MAQIGSSIGVVDRNGSGRYLKVGNIRMHGLSIDSDAIDLVRMIRGANMPTIYGSKDRVWAEEMAE